MSHQNQFHHSEYVPATVPDQFKGNCEHCCAQQGVRRSVSVENREPLDLRMLTAKHIALTCRVRRSLLAVSTVLRTLKSTVRSLAMPVGMSRSVFCIARTVRHRNIAVMCCAIVFILGLGRCAVAASPTATPPVEMPSIEQSDSLTVETLSPPEIWLSDNGYLFAPDYLPHGSELRVGDQFEGEPVESVELESATKINEQVYTILMQGGVGVVLPGSSPKAWSLKDGGYAILSCLVDPTQIESRLSAGELPSEFKEGRLREWLMSTPLPNDLRIHAIAVVSEWASTSADGQSAADAKARLATFLYPLTLVAMVLVVVSFGHLLSFCPLAAQVEGEGQVQALAISATTKSLVLFIGMEVLDLALTILANSANAMVEVNPVGGYFVNDVLGLVVFKLTLTGFAAGVLFYARTLRIAQQVSWWGCLTMTLLTARWVIFSHVAGS